jgi:membrane associated rhomboid family serine protease
MESLPERQPYRVCRACGALTPRATRWCVECGMAEMPLEEQLERQEERRFAEVFFGRATRATTSLLVMNIALFAALAGVSGEAFLPNLPYVVALVNFGGAVKAFIAQGEYWRLVTAMFLHIGILHVAINCYALWIVGQQVEKLYGSARFVVLYFLTGLAGSAASYLAPTHGAPSAGAAGAIFGLFGVLFVFGIRYHDELPGVFRRAFGARVFPTIAINLIITFSIAFIDKGAHVGGLLAGMALAAIMPYARPGERRAPVVWRAAATACIAVIIASFALAYVSPKRMADDIDVPGILVDESDSVQRFVYRYNRSDRARARTAAALTAVAAGRPVEQGIAALAAEAAEDARKARGLDPNADALLDRQAALLDRAAALLEDAGRGRASAAEVSPLLEELAALEAEWTRWVETDGRTKHGLGPVPSAGDAPGL